MGELSEIWFMAQQTLLFQVLKFTFLALIALSWAGMVSYVSKDSEKRFETEKARLFFTIFTLFSYLGGFLVYLLVRPGKTLQEKKYEKYLEETKLSSICPSCGRVLKDEFSFCPACGKEVARNCPNCENKVKKDWEFCPNCNQKL